VSLLTLRKAAKLRTTLATHIEQTTLRG